MCEDDGNGFAIAFVLIILGLMITFALMVCN